MKNFLNGSEWKKWDLQVQTILDDNYISIAKYIDEIKRLFPAQFKLLVEKIGSEDLISKYDSKEYFFTDSKETTQNRSKNYADLFCSYIETFNDCTGGIVLTDHNYEHPYLLDHLVDRAQKGLFAIIPGVEINVQGVHILVLFGDIPYEKSSYSEGIKTFLNKININNRKANDVLTVSNKSYTEVIDEVENIKAFTIYPHCNTLNGLFQERGKTDRTHLADQFNYQKFNILQANSKSAANITSEYITNNRSKFKSKYVFTIGSDSRRLADILKQDKDGNFLWIKADATFEGFKQIIFEPEERIKIQEVKPDLKEDYRIIDKVLFDSNKHTKNAISFNQNLNSIIGCRSSSKSTLLSHIAYTIDPNQVFLRGYQPPKGKNWYNFQVIWRDGLVSNVGQQTSDRGILYIPQNYINKLSEADEPNSPILSFIEKSLFANHHGVSLQSKKESLDKSVNFKNVQIESKITELFQIRQEIIKQLEKIKSLGDKEGIEKEIQKLEGAIKKQQIDFSEQEYIKYTAIIKEGVENRKKIEDIDADLKTLIEWEKNTYIPDVVKFHDFQFLSEELNIAFTEQLAELQQIFKDKFQTLVGTKKIAMDNLKQELAKKNLELKQGENLDILRKGIKNRTLQEYDLKLNAERKKLLTINYENKILQTLSASYNETIEAIVKLYEERLALKQNYVQHIAITIKEIKFSAQLEVDTSKLRKFYDDSINFHNSTEAKDELNPEVDYFVNKEFDVSSMLKEKYIKKFILLILKGKLKIKAGTTLEGVLKDYLKDYHFIKYSVQYENDEYEQMTPGKKALVVLKLIIESSEEKYPILIDQPEDDLDSRSIYDAVVPFLKEKKKERQIIIVSHNANVVVGADSEEVIVANRHDARTPNIDATEFDYSTGSLENSFTKSEERHTLPSQGIQQHVCDILEGGTTAFEKREQRYNIAH